MFVCKTLFNIAHCLAGILDMKSWFTLLETLQKIECYIIKYNLQKAPPGKMSQSRIDFTAVTKRALENLEKYNLKRINESSDSANILNRHESFEKVQKGISMSNVVEADEDGIKINALNPSMETTTKLQKELQTSSSLDSNSGVSRTSNASNYDYSNPAKKSISTVSDAAKMFVSKHFKGLSNFGKKQGGPKPSFSFITSNLMA